MSKVLLEIEEMLLGATNVTYQLILGEVNGKRKLPVVIGIPEAQSIALALEGKMLKRPNTHDLIVNVFNQFDIFLKEVMITHLEEGVFHSSLVFQHLEEIITVDSRTSDAVAIALRTNAPIYCNSEVIEEAGIEIDDKPDMAQPGRGEQDIMPPMPKSFTEELELMSLDDLEKLLDDVLKIEDYTKAAIIRDEIAKRK
jgi:uncharacterized protein